MFSSKLLLSFVSLTVQEGVLEEELGDHDFFLLQDMGSVCLLIFWGVLGHSLCHVFATWFSI